MKIITDGNSRYFCVHGGIPSFCQPSDAKDVLAKLREKSLPLQWDTLLLPSPTRAMTKELYSPIQEILWSDPCGSTLDLKFSDNTRGLGTRWSESASRIWCEVNDFSAIIRAHEVVDGIRWSHGDKVITIFSCSDYMGLGNQAGILVINSGLEEEVWDPLPKTQEFAHKAIPSCPDYFGDDDQDMDNTEVLTVTLSTKQLRGLTIVKQPARKKPSPKTRHVATKRKSASPKAAERKKRRK